MVNINPIQDQEVKIQKAGTSVILENHPTIASSPDESVFTVPTGKVWLIKGSRVSTAGGTVTKANHQINIGSESLVYLSDEDAPNNSTMMLYNDLLLKAGDEIELNTYYSATPSNIVHVLMVEEYDE